MFACSPVLRLMPARSYSQTDGQADKWPEPPIKKKKKKWLNSSPKSLSWEVRHVLIFIALLEGEPWCSHLARCEHRTVQDLPSWCSWAKLPCAGSRASGVGPITVMQSRKRFEIQFGLEIGKRGKVWTQIKQNSISTFLSSREILAHRGCIMQ